MLQRVYPEIGISREHKQVWLLEPSSKHIRNENRRRAIDVLVATGLCSKGLFESTSGFECLMKLVG